MITVHHLNNSRSQRILWLLEELALPYEVAHYERDPISQHAPAALRDVNPLGKSPVVDDNGTILIESGAIVETIIRRHGGGRLRPAPHSAAYDEYVQWLHYAEGSAMPPLMLGRTAARFGEAAAPLIARVAEQTARVIGYVDRKLAGQGFLLGDELTGADIQMSFVGEVVAARGDMASYPSLEMWVRRFQARPAYRAALKRGGPYSFARGA